MTSTATIRELLLAGHSNGHIVRTLNVSHPRVKRIRTDLGLPTHKPGPSPAGSPEDRFWRLAQSTDDGHLLWPTADKHVRAGHRGRRHSALRIAFRIRHHREPVGLVHADCDQPGCVHPDHVADKPMRDTYRAIFGEAA
ncbi:hypothetical protein ACFXD5_19535 [Streptomyces sp. NPDC059385]|uniref:hypothetical protein n=1 Tax=Streptomyces sp. NPDC059385 TaxID=3346817 RepID=UPI00368A5E5A